MSEHPYFEILQTIVINAGNAVMEYFHSESIDVVKKNDDSPLTKADTESHKIITEGLLNYFPKIPIISEENIQLTPFNERKNWSSFWLVDPLDGTKEFLNGSSEFVIMIALIENNQPTIGIIYQPSSQQGIFAKKNDGCFSFIGNENKVKLRSSFNQKNHVLRSLISKNHAEKEELILKKLFPTFNHEFLGMGSGLKFCSLSKGNSQTYLRLGPTYEWDTAAGQIILEEANFVILDIEDKTSLKYNKPSLKNQGFICLPKELSNIFINY